METATPRKGHVIAYGNTFKRKDELAPLFAPFKPLHIVQYGEHIREDEGATTHWLFVGIKEA